MNSHRPLVEAALEKSIDVRLDAGVDAITPICIFDLCHQLGLGVRFVDISMEGMYVSEAGVGAEIWLSALRPLPRRVFTCAHELGHHLFGHGSTVDAIIDRVDKQKVFDPNEFLVDTFAGFLLMPTIGVRRAFALRGWSAAHATPEQIYTLACSFGVGYETLLAHIAFSLRMITRISATELAKSSPKIIRRQILGADVAEPLVLVDDHWLLPTIDVEVGTLLLLPDTVTVSTDHLVFQSRIHSQQLFRAVRPGISRVMRTDNAWAAFVRVSAFQYVGLSRYRHLEEDIDE